MVIGFDYLIGALVGIISFTIFSYATRGNQDFGPIISMVLSILLTTGVGLILYLV